MKHTPKNALINLGERIRAARGEIPRTVLAFRIGVSWSLIRKWEDGECWPKVYHILEISRALGVAVSFLIEGVEGPSVEQALLDLKLVSERDLLEAKGYCFKRMYGDKDPQFPDWRGLAEPEVPPRLKY